LKIILIELFFFNNLQNADQLKQILLKNFNSTPLTPYISLYLTGNWNEAPKKKIVALNKYNLDYIFNSFPDHINGNLNTIFTKNTEAKMQDKQGNMLKRIEGFRPPKKFGDFIYAYILQGRTKNEKEKLLSPTVGQKDIYVVPKENFIAYVPYQ